MYLKYCFQQKYICKNFNFFFQKFYLISSLKLNEVSLRHKHSLEILFTHRKKNFHILRQCIYSKCNMNISYIKSPLRKFLKFLYSWTTKPGRDVNPMSRPPFFLLKPPRSPQKKWGRDTKPPPCRLNHVVTLNRCRDTTQAYPGRDTKTRSRPSWRLPYVATSISCRDTVSAHSGPSSSQHQKSMSRPPTLPPMSRHHIHVATPFLPTQSRPGRDFTSWSRPHAQPRPN